jgi:hypothetical protein
MTEWYYVQRYALDTTGPFYEMDEKWLDAFKTNLGQRADGPQLSSHLRDKAKHAIHSAKNHHRRVLYDDTKLPLSATAGAELVIEHTNVNASAQRFIVFLGIP